MSLPRLPIRILRLLCSRGLFSLSLLHSYETHEALCCHFFLELLEKGQVPVAQHIGMRGIGLQCNHPLSAPAVRSVMVLEAIVAAR